MLFCIIKVCNHHKEMTVTKGFNISTQTLYPDTVDCVCSLSHYITRAVSSCTTWTKCKYSLFQCRTWYTNLEYDIKILSYN